MMSDFQKAVEEAIGIVLFVPPDHAFFHILALVALAALALFGHLLAANVAGSKNGWLAHTFAVFIPIFCGIIGMALSKMYIEPHITEAETAYWVTIGAGVLVFAIAAVIAANSLLESAGIIGMGTMTLTLGAMVSVVAMAKVGLESFKGSEKIIQESKDRFELE